MLAGLRVTQALTAACFFFPSSLPRPEAQGDPLLKRAQNSSMVTEGGVSVAEA